MHRSSLVFFVAFGLVVGCAHGDADDAPTGAAASTSQRSEACLKFQKSFCTWDVTMCSTDTMATCEDTASSLFCASDDKATACTTAIPTASCAALPAACQGVIDPAPAIADCNALLDDYCAASERCGQGKKADCLTTNASSMNCPSAIGAAPTIDRCFSDLSSVSCDTFAQSLPTSCTGVIKVSTSGTAPGGAMLRPRPAFLDVVALPDVAAR